MSSKDALFLTPAVNNFGLDPFSGFDFEVWVNDVSSGQVAWFGKFQSLTLSIRNSTETYLELGQRVPVYLDGEFNIAWVLEQGLVDGEFMGRTFGTNEIGRDQVLGRSPRFQITFDANAAELVSSPLTRSGTDSRRLGSLDFWNIDSNVDNQSGIEFPSNSAASRNRRAKFRYEITRCKVDNYSVGFMPGRRVPAQRWEGVAEGIRYIPESVQQFKNNTRPISVGSSSSSFGNSITQ